ncbi:GntR family transcriptional regulator [Kutzneria sp. NPDC051319]|uniref:GntR family transcriptional regulator n=1 Tax=Kutzneria sp. NPDC051319 TaxID=3155047 RepID=UPI00344A7C1F
MPDSDAWISVSTPYVKPRDADAPDAWAQEAADHGHVGTQRLLHVGEVMPAPHVAAALHSSPTAPVVVRRRLVLLDDQPLELVDSYYPADIARGTSLAEARKIRGGAPTLLAELGHEFRHLDEDVSVRLANAEETELLAQQGPTPVLVLRRTSSARSGRPVEVSVMTMLPGRHLRYQLTIEAVE